LLKNNPEKFKRDLKLFRGLMILLALSSLYISYDYFLSEECGKGSGSVITEICHLFGSDFAAVSTLICGFILIYTGFSKTSKLRMKKLYS
jgi:hypothetical protein